jgi:hypothetical protein
MYLMLQDGYITGARRSVTPRRALAQQFGAFKGLWQRNLTLAQGFTFLEGALLPKARSTMPSSCIEILWKNRRGTQTHGAL